MKLTALTAASPTSQRQAGPSGRPSGNSSNVKGMDKPTATGQPTFVAVASSRQPNPDSPGSVARASMT